jgi:HK97 family phage portal protein
MWPFRRKSDADVEERSISFQDFWGSGADTAAVNAGTIGTALTLAPVWAATRLIADSIAALPLQAYRDIAGVSQAITTPQLLVAPSIFGGPYEWVQRALTSLLLRGNAYGLITSRDMNGWPRQVEWLHPDDVTVGDNRAIRRPQWFWLGRPIDPWLGRDSTGELLHIPWYVVPGEVLGLSPIAAFATTIETGILSQRFGRNFFRADAVPSAVLETDQAVNQDQATIIKARFAKAASGREPVVLGAGTKYKPITVPPEESQFLQTIKATSTQIAAIYGLWPEDVGGESGNSMTYANIEFESISRSHRLAPYMTKLEQHVSSLMPRPQYARFNLDAYLRADTKTRYETHAIALDKKFKTVDEVRKLEDMPPLTVEQKAEIAASQPALPAPVAAPPNPVAQPDNVISLPSAANK